MDKGWVIECNVWVDLFYGWFFFLKIKEGSLFCLVGFGKIGK